MAQKYWITRNIDRIDEYFVDEISLQYANKQIEKIEQYKETGKILTEEQEEYLMHLEMIENEKNNNKRKYGFQPKEIQRTEIQENQIGNEDEDLLTKPQIENITIQTQPTPTMHSFLENIKTNNSIENIFNQTIVQQIQREANTTILTLNQDEETGTILKTLLFPTLPENYFTELTNEPEVTEKFIQMEQNLKLLFPAEEMYSDQPSTQRQFLHLEEYYSTLYKRLRKSDLENLYAMRQEMVELHELVAQRIPASEQILEQTENPTTQEINIYQNQISVKYQTARDIVYIDKFIINEIRYFYSDLALSKLLSYEDQLRYNQGIEGKLTGPEKQYYNQLIEQLNLAEKIRHLYNIEDINVVHKRYKRQALLVGAIGGMIVGGLLADRRMHNMEIAIDELDQRTRVLTNEMVEVQGQMITLTKTTMKEFEKVKQAISQTNDRIDYIAAEIAQMEQAQIAIIRDIEQIHYALYYLSYIVGSLFPAIERKLSMYEYMMTQIEFLMDAMDNLSNGLVSHKLIEPKDFQRMITKVDENVKKNYPEYTLLMKEVQQYYDLPLTRFTSHENKLIIQIPMYIQHYTQTPLQLYNLKTIPVPYNINQQLKATKLEQHPYTQLHPKHPLLALGHSTYISLEITDLHNCYHLGNYYLCEQTFLAQRSTQHTCESAIYHKLPTIKIKELCDFTYYPNLIPEPTILDTGEDILMGNIPMPWTFYCADEKKVPNIQTGGTYVQIKRSTMCQCSLSVGKYYIHENIVTCVNKSRTPIQLYYTINQAAAIYFPKTEMDVNLEENVMTKLPVNISLPIPDFEQPENLTTGVALYRPEIEAGPWKQVRKHQDSQQKLFKSKADKLAHTQTYKEQRKQKVWTYVKWIVSIIIIVIIIGGCIWLIGYCNLRKLIRTPVTKIWNPRNYFQKKVWPFTVSRRIPETIPMARFHRNNGTNGTDSIELGYNNQICDICGTIKTKGVCNKCHPIEEPNIEPMPSTSIN